VKGGGGSLTEFTGDALRSKHSIERKSQKEKGGGEYKKGERKEKNAEGDKKKI